MFDWNDLRHFLAVARTGSTLVATRTLRVSQATVLGFDEAAKAESRCLSGEVRLTTVESGQTPGSSRRSSAFTPAIRI